VQETSKTKYKKAKTP